MLPRQPLRSSPGAPARGTTQPPGTPRSSPQLQSLTGIRGLAAWWVVIYHFRELLPQGLAGPLRAVVAHGYLAVDLFFVLSGFVIALNYADRFAASLKGSMTFYGLRLARIYPLHLFMMVLYLANPVALWMYSDTGIDVVRYEPGYWFLSLLLCQNWGFTGDLRWNIPAWSISTEWLAYLLFPVIAWVGLRVARNAPAVLACIFVLLLGLVAAAVSTGSTLGQDIPRLGAIRCLLEFNLGALVHRLYCHMPRHSSRSSSLIMILSIALIASYIVLPVPDYIVMPAAFVCLVLALADQRLLVSVWLSNRFLVWLGAISYSTYLAHYFVRDWTKFLLVGNGVSPAVILTIYLATVFTASIALHHLVEIPGQRLVRAVVLRHGRLRDRSYHPARST